MIGFESEEVQLCKLCDRLRLMSTKSWFSSEGPFETYVGSKG
jgi:hypothetical protein